ncbi:hypothetical protein NMY22_g5101 [Coprinellus aureogranulatus]|nr:hypothetical protein NMY22_g5101 [Coprinellus aureogranulatus]
MRRLRGLGQLEPNHLDVILFYSEGQLHCPDRPETVPMLQGLPSELLYEVLSNLAGDTKALSACALTCQALSLPSRTILFAAVELHLHAAVANLEAPHNLEPPREAKLLKVLQQNPKFILLVQDVSIYDLFGGEELIVADPELNSDVVEIFRQNR